MPIFLDTTGNASLAIAVCDRCKMKRYYSVMRKDPNFPGLRVCDQGCADQFDPYRLPARKTERINLRFPRPDVSVADDNEYLVTSTGNNLQISSTQNNNTPGNNGNINPLTPST